MKKLSTLKALGMQLGTLSGLIKYLKLLPGFSLRSNPGLKLANAFGVDFELGLKPANAVGVKLARIGERLQR